jgi:hypothetical protein
MIHRSFQASSIDLVAGVLHESGELRDRHLKLADEVPSYIHGMARPLN